MIVYRIVGEKYSTDLSGRGAELYGGRWNNKGLALIYTSESKALAALELAVNTDLAKMPKPLVITAIKIPNNSAVDTVDLLPKGWDSFPHINETKIIGDTFGLTLKYLVLKVPSAIMPDEFNYLINPAHKNFSKIKIVNQEPFKLDRRFYEARKK